MKLKSIIWLLVLIGCSPKQEINGKLNGYPKWDVPVKPFYIINKYHINDKQNAVVPMCGFWYIDGNGAQFVMNDFCNKLSVGDTVK